MSASTLGNYEYTMVTFHVRVHSFSQILRMWASQFLNIRLSEPLMRSLTIGCIDTVCIMFHVPFVFVVTRNSYDDSYDDHHQEENKPTNYNYNIRK